MGDLACSLNICQVHPHVFTTHRRQSPTDLFTELEELKETESKLVELVECRMLD